VYDGRGQLATLTPFQRAGHSATRLGDGTVLLAGGGSNGVATTDAFIFLRSPLGPFTNLPTVAFDGARDPVLLRRADGAMIVDGRLQLHATAAGEGGRPGELALVAGMRTSGEQVTLLAGRAGAAAAVLILGWQSEAQYAFVTVEPGRPVTLFTVTPGRPTQSLVTAVDGCSGQVVDPAELPDGDLAPIVFSARGVVQVGTPTRTWLLCAPKTPLGRGLVGVGALYGTVTFDDVLITR